MVFSIKAEQVVFKSRIVLENLCISVGGYFYFLYINLKLLYRHHHVPFFFSVIHQNKAKTINMLYNKAGTT